MKIFCEFSPYRTHRYVWEAFWDESKPPCAFIGLNPSTADEGGPDPTVRRCVNYAKKWGCGRLFMLNLFAYRATDPKAMKIQADPVGPMNDHWLLDRSDYVALRGGIVVAAWGAHGEHMGRSSDVVTLLAGVPLHYLTLTKGGEPGHPLYLKGDLKPTRWE